MKLWVCTKIHRRGVGCATTRPTRRGSRLRGNKGTGTNSANNRAAVTGVMSDRIPNPVGPTTPFFPSLILLALTGRARGRYHYFNQGAVMTNILCEQVSPGLREADAILTLLDVQGRRHFLQIEMDLLVRKNGNSYLSVGFVHRDARTGAFLIEL